MELQTLIPSILPSLISGLVLFKIGTMNRSSESREDNRQREGVLLLKSLDAIGSLSEMTALCYKGVKPNGELDKAIEERRKIKKELQDHLYEEHEEMKRK